MVTNKEKELINDFHTLRHYEAKEGGLMKIIEKYELEKDYEAVRAAMLSKFPILKRYEREDVDKMDIVVTVPKNEIEHCEIQVMIKGKDKCKHYRKIADIANTGKAPGDYYCSQCKKWFSITKEQIKQKKDEMEENSFMARRKKG